MQLHNELNQALDYSDVLTQIAAFASFSRSQEKIMNSLPMTDLNRIRSAQALVTEAIRYLQAGKDYSAGGITDVEAEVRAAEKGIVLTAEELLSVAQLLAAVRDIRKLFSEETEPELADLAGTMDECGRLFQSIMEKIDLSGSVREDASARLRSLYRQNASLKAALSARGRAFVKRNSDSLMENMTTTIQGRMVVLLKAAEKYRFGGMVHGSSQSGQAYYVEPAELVELNNDLQSNVQDIEEEKRQIRKDLSRGVRNSALAITSDLETLELIDTAFAKARWSMEHDGSVPVISDAVHGFLFEHAVHPLLDRSKAVPNTYELKDGQQVLMMSGPNMGGKTVTLKTIGLFTALAHAGFPVSAHRARLPFFRQMFFDIGDNQSIENNLSTFSAHAARLSELTGRADSDTFVLLDEIGNGTDPLEGASLAQAVLENLIDHGSVVVTSTHFDEVKAYGKSDPRILVSSVEFNPETFRPTYRYLPGISGSSYAFEIAESFPFQKSILERARQLKRDNESDVQKQLEALEKEQQEALKKQERFDALIQDAHALQKKAAHDQEVLERKKKRFDEKYEAKLQAELDSKKEEARQILKKIRKMSGSMNHEQIEAMAEIDALKPGTRQEKRKADATLKPGDYVHIEVLNGHGEILSIKKNRAVVLSSGKKITVSLDQLSRISRPKTDKVRKPHQDRTFEAFPLELNLIGMRVEEAMQALDHYMDQAVYKRVKNVRIIHGMGTGALRNAVWDDLKHRNSVRKFTSAGPSDGGLGATLVELK